MNVLNDNWLFVRYTNGKVKQISVRQAFKDAEKIKNIETPTFHNVSISIYDVPVIQFLSTLLLAAYFKPKTKFCASSKQFNAKLVKEGWSDDLLTKYFNKWEDRFNLFDDKYPFLQDIRLKEEIEEPKKDSLGYISKANLVAPAGNNLIFEHNSATKTDIKDFKPTNDELVYILLYLRSIGTSPMAVQYPNKTICSNATLFITNYGKNLKETIIANCLPLRDSDAGANYDRPVWEFDSLDEIKEFDLGELNKNVLLCTYFPCYPIYIQYEDNDLKNIILAKNTDLSVLDKEARVGLSDAYVFYNPWAIKKYVVDKKTEIGTWSYKEWDNTLKLMNLCIEITNQTPQGFYCNLINTEYQANSDVKNIIYYREYDGMKSNVLSFGKYTVEKGILTKLQNAKNHEKAVTFQENLNKIQSKFIIFKDSGLTDKSIKEIKLAFSKYAENYFFEEFVTNITKKDITDDTLDIFIKEAKTIVKKLEAITNNPLRYAEAYRKFCGSLNKLKEGTKENENI